MKKIVVFYDNWCPNCTRFIEIVKKLDWLDLIDEKKLRNLSDTSKFPDLNPILAKEQMASYKDSKWNYGYISIYHIFLRLPIFWLFIPFFFILNISKLGNYLYMELALKRKIIPLHCDKESCEI